MRATMLVVLLLSIALPAVAADEAPEPLRRWLDGLPEKERLDVEARRDLEVQVADAEDPLEAALRLLRPAYGAALDVLETEGEEAGIARLAKLEKESPDATTAAFARYRRAEALLLLERTKEAVPLLGELAESPHLVGTAAERAVHFLRAFAFAREGKKLGAFRLFQEYLARWPDAPERYRALARQIVRELESEYLSPLLDLSGKMKDIARLLERARTGEPTQEKQEEVVRLLKQLIELAKKMEQAGKGAGSSRSSGSSRAGGVPDNPAEDSFLPEGPTSTGRLRRVSRGDPDEAWGELRPKEREEALQFLRERFPGRYHELLKEYYRRLSEEK
jgi:hypothetical protein